MASEFSRSLLKVAVAQICQNIGWNAVQTSPLEVLVDIAHRYLVELSRTTHQYSNQYNRSEPNVVDLCLAFRLMGVQLHELEEYVNNVEPVPFAHQVAAFPLPHNSNFQFPKPKSRAVAQRPEWIHEHLPLTHPEQEGEEPSPSTPEPSDGAKVFDVPDSPSSSSSEDLDINSSSIGGIKRPNDGSMEPHVKRTKIPFEDEGRPMRELVSIFMTPSGVISPAREGKMPEPRIPAKNVESTPESPDIISSSSSSSSSVSLPVDIAVPKPVKPIKKDKSKMLKFKKDMVLKKHMKKMKLPKNKSPSYRFPFDPPPAMVKREGVFPDDLKIKKRKKSSDIKLSKMKPINKIRIAKDKSFRAKELLPPLPIMKSPKSKHRIKSPSHSSVGYPRSPKSPKGLKFHALSKHSHGPKSPKMHFPIEKQIVNPVLPPTPIVHKPQLPEPHEPIMPVKIEPLRPIVDDDDDEDDISRDTPEPRLIIDDEAQARHEKESRMADLDDCINEVIKRAQNEMESENKESERNVDDAIDSVIRSSKKLEPRDVYDFTDSSDDGDSLPKTPKTPEPTISSPPPKIKKEKTKSPEVIATPPENPKKKKDKTKTPKRKPVKDKPKPSALNFHKFGRSGSQVKRAPSPTFDDSDSSDIVSLPSPGPSTPSQNSPASRGNFNQFSPLGNSFLSPFGANKFGGMGFPSSSGPFSPLRPLPSNPFPTPPLFVPPKFESAISQAQPINLALPSGSTSKEKTQDRKHSFGEGSSKKPPKVAEEVDKPSKNVKEHKKKPEKKEKIKKKNTKEKGKEKSKKFVPPSPPSPPPAPKTPPPPPPPPITIPEAKKSSPVEKKPPKPPKTKAEKKAKPTKIEKEKTKKTKEKEEKVKDDPSSVPKITLKLGSNTPNSSGSTKIVIKMNQSSFSQTPISASSSTCSESLGRSSSHISNNPSAYPSHSFPQSVNPVLSIQHASMSNPSPLPSSAVPSPIMPVVIKKSKRKQWRLRNLRKALPRITLKLSNHGFYKVKNSLARIRHHQHRRVMVQLSKSSKRAEREQGTNIPRICLKVSNKNQLWSVNNDSLVSFQSQNEQTSYLPRLSLKLSNSECQKDTCGSNLNVGLPKLSLKLLSPDTGYSCLATSQYSSRITLKLSSSKLKTNNEKNKKRSTKKNHMPLYANSSNKIANISTVTIVKNAKIRLQRLNIEKYMVNGSVLLLPAFLKLLKKNNESTASHPRTFPESSIPLFFKRPLKRKCVIKTSGKDSRSCSPAKEIPPSPEPSPSPPPPPVSRIKSPPPAAPPPPMRGAAAAAAAATASAVSGGTSGGRGRQGGRGRGAAKRAALPTPCIVTTKTLGTITDESGNKIWICPACTRPDDGSPMIGCDECDDWYHWVCVGIVVPPKEEEEWFCSRCISKKQSFGTKKRHKKHKKDK